MNKQRIVNIRSSNGFSPGDPWRDGAAALVGNTLLTDIDDLTVPEKVELVLSEPNFGVVVDNKYDVPFEEILKKVTGSSRTQLATRAAEIGLASYKGESTKFNPWFKGLKTWNGTEVTIPALTFEFAMGQFGLWNAKSEVFAPILGLLALGLPERQNVLTADGSFISTASLISMYIENSAGFISNYVAGNTDGEGLLGNISTILRETLSETKTRYYHVDVGASFTLQYCIIQGVTVRLSSEVDQYGYPIKGTATISLVGTLPPAVDSVYNLGALRFGPRGV